MCGELRGPYKQFSPTLTLLKMLFVLALQTHNNHQGMGIFANVAIKILNQDATEIHILLFLQTHFHTDLETVLISVIKTEYLWFILIATEGGSCSTLQTLVLKIPDMLGSNW